MALIDTIKKFRSKSKKPVADGEGGEMSFLDHLEELRWHLLRSGTAIVVLAIVIFIYRKFVFDEVIFKVISNEFPLNKWICSFWNNGDGTCLEGISSKMQNLSPQAGFLKSIQVGFIGGIIVAFPYIIWEIWAFIKPGLHKHERRAIRGSIFVISLLFFSGIAFGYYIISPFSLKFFHDFPFSENVENQWNFSVVVDLVTQITFFTGIIFQLPVVMFYLAKMGLVTPAFLQRYRRHAVAILLLAAAIITPPDMISQVMIFIPLYGLYEVSIVVTGRVVKRREKELAKEMAERQKEQQEEKTSA
ncbi:MAG: twin-arginine translocase subunit TatC [Bacteroidota bacterium]